jgi:hypothetical protein
LASYRPLSSLCHARNRTTDRDTIPMHRDRAIPASQRPHPSRNSAEPHQRPRPPNFARQRHRRIRSPKLPTIGKQKPNLAQQLLARHSEQSADARILQRRHRKPSALQNRRQPSRNPGTKRALRVKKQPPPRVPALPVCKLRCQRNHGFLLLCVLSALWVAESLSFSIFSAVNF